MAKETALFTGLLREKTQSQGANSAPGLLKEKSNKAGTRTLKVMSRAPFLACLLAEFEPLPEFGSFEGLHCCSRRLVE